MDTGLLNFSKENFHTNDYYELHHEFDEDVLIDTSRSYQWDNENNNVDLALKSMTDEFCQSIQDVAEMFPNDIFQTVDFQLLDHNKDCEDIPTSNFDLSEFINNDATNIKSLIQRPSLKAGVKKIDMKAKKYILYDNESDNYYENDKEDDEVDVETVSNNPPVLEAGDAFSLLEQFEKSENIKVPLNQLADMSYTNLMLRMQDIENSELAFERISKFPEQIFNNPGEDKLCNSPLVNLNLDKKQFNCNENDTKLKIDKIVEDKEKKKLLNKCTNNKKIKVVSEIKNEKKLILDALPQDLIKCINESDKRKTITVIDPITPKRKRIASRKLDNLTQMKNSKLMKLSSNVDELWSTIKLDHNYCTTFIPHIKKEIKKDSGFVSSEDDDRNTINNQPIVKNTDGKLMVSLLKVNTIRNNNINNSNNEENKKKKLNLEEYKKRRFLNSSETNSATSSTCSSPLPRSQCNSPFLENELIKRQKYEEKMKKMTAELLKTTPQKIKKSHIDTKNIDINDKKDIIIKQITNQEHNKIITPPPDLEVKTFVSVGCNTDFDDFDIDSVEQLAEIKPLLQKASNKINQNSFINSLIENIPKFKSRNQQDKQHSNYKAERQEIIRENKTIQYLKKNRPIIETKNVCSQTNVSLINQMVLPRYRRRSNSTSSSSSCESFVSSRRTTSRSSCHSRQTLSRCSSSSYSPLTRSRSRSISPLMVTQRSKRYNEERIREVEERRVIYVGRLKNGTTKEDLRRRFCSFGPITNISIYFREFGNNYGFVTFVNKSDAYAAVGHGNDHAFPKYDLSFGGRRLFCKTSYSDLDDVRDDYGTFSTKAAEIPFDVLLKATQEELRKRRP